MTVQGHPRSLIWVLIESAYATSYWSSIVTLHGPILPRFRDAAISLKRGNKWIWGHACPLPQHRTARLQNGRKLRKSWRHRSRLCVDVIRKLKVSKKDVRSAWPSDRNTPFPLGNWVIATSQCYKLFDRGRLAIALHFTEFHRIFSSPWNFNDATCVTPLGWTPLGIMDRIGQGLGLRLGLRKGLGFVLSAPILHCFCWAVA